MSQLRTQMSSTVSKFEPSIMDGCFKGLYHCLKAFPLRKSDNDNNFWEFLYDAVLKNSDYRDENRRVYRRSALNVFQRHAHFWKTKLIQTEDCQRWFVNLKMWTESSNKDDHKLGWKCFDAFLNTIKYEFDEQNSEHKTSFEFLLSNFITTIKSSSKKETSLGILGYGSLAYGCKLYKGIDKVVQMLEELINKIQEVFFSSPEEKGEWLIYYPSYVKAIADVITVLEASLVPIEVIDATEKIVEQLVIDYPKLPPQFKGFAVEAFTESVKHLNVKTIVLKSLVHTCSYPICTDLENEDMDVISTKSFLSFWKNVSKTKIIEQALTEAVLEIINRLNFDTDTFEAVINDKSEIIQETLVSSLSQAIIMEEQPLLSDGYVKKIKKPKKVKDHTVLANLVIIFCECPFIIDRKWLKTIMIQSTQYPEVSGFYKLLSKTLDKSHTFFEQNSDMFHTCIQFLVEVIEKCHSFEHELLISFLKMVTNLPMEFVRCLLPYLSKPMLR